MSLHQTVCRFISLLAIFALSAAQAASALDVTPAELAKAKAWLTEHLLSAQPEKALTTNLPFSFTFNGQPSSTLLSQVQVHRTDRQLDASRLEHSLAWNVGDLEVRCVLTEYRDFPTVEWTLYFTSTGSNDSPLLENIRALDSDFTTSAPEFILHHNKGTFVRADDFEPLTTPLKKGDSKRFTPPAGRPCGQVWPYFNLEGKGDGTIIVVGWPGQWTANFSHADQGHCRVAAGQELTHLRLHPGESVRSPLVVLQFWEGDWLRSQNLWRRWMLAHNLPKPGGRLTHPLMPACSSHQFAEMINANEANQKLFIDRYLAEGLFIDYWWMDAGWYINKSGWPNTGTWLVDSNRFPNGLRAISDYAHSKKVKSLVWFEPERVTPGTWLHEQHPEWLLNGTLLNLGNSNAWHWLVDHIDKTIVEQAIDLYRQDYNIDPLQYWRSADTPERQGITENHYITGYLAYWDELRRRHPAMLIDSCASGGHRNDLETLRRSLPFLRSDFIQDAVGNQGHTYGLSFWLPYHGTGTDQMGVYEVRSAMSCPHFIACWDVREPKLNYELLRKLVKEWRNYSENFYGDYYPLTPYSLDGQAWLAWQFDRPEKNTGLIQVFRRPGSFYEAARFKLQGLDPQKRYQITNADDPANPKTFTGAELTDPGVPVTLSQAPAAAVITYQVVP